MTRTITIKGKEYYVITTTMMVDGIEVSVQVNISTSSLDNKSKYKIQRYADLFFNRVFKLQPKTIPQPKKAWYQFW